MSSRPRPSATLNTALADANVAVAIPVFGEAARMLAAQRPSLGEPVLWLWLPSVDERSETTAQATLPKVVPCWMMSARPG